MKFFCYFHKKVWDWFWVWPMLARFLPKYDFKIAIFNSFTGFFSELQYYIISSKYINFLTYLNRNQQKNLRWISLHHFFRNILHTHFIGAKTATSNGWQKCVKFVGRVMNLTWDPILSQITANEPSPLSCGSTILKKPPWKSARIKPSTFCCVKPGT